MDDDNISVINAGGNGNYSLMEQRRINVDGDGNVTDCVIKRQCGEQISVHRYELQNGQLRLVEKKYRSCPTSEAKERFNTIWELINEQSPQI